MVPLPCLHASACSPASWLGHFLVGHPSPRKRCLKDGDTQRLPSSEGIASGNSPSDHLIQDSAAFTCVPTLFLQTFFIC